MTANEVLFIVKYSLNVSDEFKDFILKHGLSTADIDFMYDEDNGVVTLSAHTSYYGL